MLTVIKYSIKLWMLHAWVTVIRSLDVFSVTNVEPRHRAVSEVKLGGIEKMF